MLLTLKFSSQSCVSTVGGGAVFAVKFKVLKVTPVMSKVFCGDQLVLKAENKDAGKEEEDGGAAAAVTGAGAGAGLQFVVLGPAEAAALYRLLDAQRARLVDSVAQAEELQLGSLLEDLDVDERIAGALLVGAVSKRLQYLSVCVCVCARACVREKEHFSGCMCFFIIDVLVPVMSYAVLCVFKINIFFCFTALCLCSRWSAGASRSTTRTWTATRS
jgi:hypothetical protein